MTCEICKRGIADGIALFRQNPKGEKGIWRCREHNQAAIDPEVNDIVTVVEDNNRGAR